MSRREECENDRHHEPSCSHGSQARFGCEQTLDELEFEKSVFGCAVYGDLERLRAIVVKRGRECLNDQDRNGYTCLHYAVRNSKNYEMCKFLLENGVNVNATTRSCRSTPLHRACYMGNADIVVLLTRTGCRVAEQDCDGKTPLHKCVEQFVDTSQADKKELFKKCIQILIKLDDNLVYIKDFNGISPFDIYSNILELKV